MSYFGDTCQPFMEWDIWEHDDHMVGVMGHDQTHQPNPSFWIYFLIRKERKRRREKERVPWTDREGERNKDLGDKRNYIVWLTMIMRVRT